MATSLLMSMKALRAGPGVAPHQVGDTSANAHGGGNRPGSGGRSRRTGPVRGRQATSDEGASNTSFTNRNRLGNWLSRPAHEPRVSMGADDEVPDRCSSRMSFLASGSGGAGGGGGKAILARVAEMEASVAERFDQMGERITASEDRLKVRITQMEVAVMGAVKAMQAQAASGATAGPSRPTLDRGQRRGPGYTALGASAPGGTIVASNPASSLAEASSLTSQAYDRHGETVDAMQALVDSDSEIRSMLNQLRRQVQKAQLFRKPTAANLDASAVSTPRAEFARPVGVAPGSIARCMRTLFGPVIHPDERFRSVWNALMAFLICYCGIAIPLEIAFEDDMVLALCDTTKLTVGSHELASTIVDQSLRNSCTNFQLWFWFNLIVDLWFIFDIFLNLRTGYVVEGHFVNDEWMAMKRYLKGSFLFDGVASFPINLLIYAINTENDEGAGAARANKMLRLLRMAKLTKLVRMLKLGTYLEYGAPLASRHPHSCHLPPPCRVPSRPVTSRHVPPRPITSHYVPSPPTSHLPPPALTGTSRSSLSSTRACCASSSSASFRSSSATGSVVSGGSSPTSR